MKHTKLIKIIGLKFRTFGGGQTDKSNPIAMVLKDAPFQFAAGVSVEAVINAVLKESGHDALLAVCKEALEYFKHHDLEHKCVSVLGLLLNKTVAESEV